VETVPIKELAMIMKLTPLCSFFLVVATAAAQDWPNWRGPQHDGSAEAKNLPTDFSQSKLIRWTSALPGPGAGTPIVVGDHIFLTSVDTKRERLVALCLDRGDGALLWSKDAGSGYTGSSGQGSRVARGSRSNYASPSPVTDGERVIFFFGNGDLVALDLDGEEVWRSNIQKDHGDFAFLWTFSSSPTIWDGKVFLPIMQRDTPIGGNKRKPQRRKYRAPSAGSLQTPEEAPQPIQSFLLALDAKTGKPLYKTERSSPAISESRESYATAIPFVGENGRKELLVVGADILTSHDPATGKELWRWGTWNDDHRQRSWRLVPSSVVGGGVTLACAPKRQPVYAIRLGGKGTLGEDSIAWKSEGRPNPVSSDVPTPAYYRNHFYVLSDVASALSKIHPASGKVLWTTPLSRDYRWRASPTAADGKIWCLNHHGDVTIVDADSGGIVSRISMGDEDDDNIRSSIVVAHGALFIRTNSTLFCIGR
jgi:outer membrane protein assembly factor BamB